MRKGLLGAGLLALLLVPIPIRAETPDPTPDSGNLIDNTHDFLANSFYWPLAYFDQLFSAEKEEFQVNQSFFRVISNYTVTENGKPAFRPQLRMRIRLKSLQRRLSIIAFGENDNEASPDISISKQAETTTPVGKDTIRTRIGFRYSMFEWFNSRFDADIVVSSKLFPEPSLRGRQILYKSSTILSRFTVTGFYKQDLRFGQTTRLDYTHQLAKRWSYDATVTGRQSQAIPELAWDSAVNTNYLPSSRDALALRFQMYGPTRPHAVVQDYRTSLMYRRNFYRSWMFYEVEPAVDWPYINDHRSPVWSTAFRLELQFKSS